MDAAALWTAARVGNAGLVLGQAVQTDTTDPVLDCSSVTSNHRPVWKSAKALQRSPHMFPKHAKTAFYPTYGKRILDIALVAPMFFVLAPLLALLSLLVRLQLGPNVYFHQLRPGRSGVLFALHKFRTMSDARMPGGQLLLDEARLTRFGRLLRSTSLDELPELWNVLRGDMSLVGPRPLLQQYLNRYTPEQARRHEVQPGVTGWAQVNGRNAISWEQKFAYDVWYVDHVSLWLDLKILAMTAQKVFQRDGINQPGHATMEEFLGTAPDAGS